MRNSLDYILEQIVRAGGHIIQNGKYAFKVCGINNDKYLFAKHYQSDTQLNKLIAAVKKL